MKSEFQNVALDRIRYSLVWEDSQTLWQALDIGQNDHLLIISSAGCNVLNALLRQPASVTAVDLNPVQNKLLWLKMHIIAHHDFTVYRALMGFDGTKSVSDAKQVLLQTLPGAERRYWDDFFTLHPEGTLTSGRLEKYITGFYKTLEEDIQETLCQLIACKHVEEQHDFFMQHLHNSNFRPAFIDYFDDDNLSKGRDQRLLKYAAESGKLAFYNRLKKLVRTSLVSNNFYFRFFFFGPLQLPECILPPCYREQHYTNLRQQLPKLQVVTGEAINYLLSAPGRVINKASLSNIFEYASREEFEKVCNALAADPNRILRIIFWNLLNGQGEDTGLHHCDLKVLEVQPSEQRCFYFKNVLLLHNTNI